MCSRWSLPGESPIGERAPSIVTARVATRPTGRGTACVPPGRRSVPDGGLPPRATGFTSRQELDDLMASVAGLGYSVEPLEVSGALADVAGVLGAMRPDLVFNLAEGWSGPWRQSVLPELYEELGLPYTGSGPAALALALDKHRTKLTLHQAGLPTPPSVFLTPFLPPDAAMTALSGLPFPVIVKPNFESCSKGITDNSLAHTAKEATMPATAAAGGVFDYDLRGWPSTHWACGTWPEPTSASLRTAACTCWRSTDSPGSPSTAPPTSLRPGGPRPPPRHGRRHHRLSPHPLRRLTERQPATPRPGGSSARDGGGIPPASPPPSVSQPSNWPAPPGASGGTNAGSSSPSTPASDHADELPRYS